MGSNPYLTSLPLSVLLSVSAATSLVQVTTILNLTDYNGLLVGLPEMALDPLGHSPPSNKVIFLKYKSDEHPFA